MNTYIKVIGLTGSHFVKEFSKIKHYDNKIREVSEETVAKKFKEGNTKVIVQFEEDGREIELDDFSDPQLIKKYLGKHFV
jgi:hypothetical protein